MATANAFMCGRRSIGGGQPCYVIAEAGVNHDGDLARAKQLVDAAHAAGADAVKFQTWLTDELVAAEAELAGYQREQVPDAEDQAAMLRGLELPHEAFRELKTYADAVGIEFLSTPDEPRSLAFLVELGVPVIKVGSPEVTNTPYLRQIGATRLPVVLSTGMSTLGEVERAVSTLEGAGTPSLVVLQCTSAYPTPAADANLRAMETLAAAFGHPVGFSDHTLGLEIAIAAVARGACMLEKHLTLDRSLPGPDHATSLEPERFAELVRSIRNVEQALGDGVKDVRPVEADARRTMQKVVVAAHALVEGATLGSTDLTLLRRGAGIPPAELDSLVGRKLLRPLGAGEPLTRDAVAW